MGLLRELFTHARTQGGIRADTVITPDHEAREASFAFDPSEPRDAAGKWTGKPSHADRAHAALAGGRLLLAESIARAAGLTRKQGRDALDQLLAEGRVEGTASGGYRHRDTTVSAPALASPHAVDPQAVAGLRQLVERLEREHGLADLADVRDALSHLSRQEQDALIQEARRQGHVAGSAYEGREGLTERQRAAALEERGGRIGYLAVRKKD